MFDMLAPDSGKEGGASTSRGTDAEAAFYDEQHEQADRVKEADSKNQMLQQALCWHANMRLCAGAHQFPCWILCFQMFCPDFLRADRYNCLG